jgi:D-amino-acid oxidase
VAPNPEVVIVGAGVVGLSTAVRLADGGVRVRIFTDRRGPGTCSYAAGAMFDPFLATHARRRTWADTTRQEFERLREEEGLPSVTLVDGVEASRVAMSPPDGLSACPPGELPPGFVTGWRYRVPLVDMPPYLEWLEQRFEKAEGEIEYRRLKTLDEGFEHANIVVNCTGIGALSLVPDGSMRPIRGQLVAIRNPNPRIDEFFVEHTPDLEVSESTYLLPQGDVLLLGGNAEKGELDVESDPGVAERILQRCVKAFPQIAGAEVLGNRVGIRPQRPTVRLEHQNLGTRHIVHNYGHGGSGVSLSWGCADEAAGIVAGLLGRPAVQSPAPAGV